MKAVVTARSVANEDYFRQGENVEEREQMPLALIHTHQMFARR
jgi:hypothetical protein